MYSTNSKTLQSAALELIAEWSGDLLCFLMKASSALVPMTAMFRSERGQGNAGKQTVCDIDTLDLQLEIYRQTVVRHYNNARPHTVVVMQRALQSVEMLPWPARSSDLSRIEHVWDVIERQLQHHP
ncbi:uncharacterized protein TNCV_2604081 [Trichonephila clavipes]|nr:uncharacterized protein TNCV_2604081 [Trichonephila clavipes]